MEVHERGDRRKGTGGGGRGISSGLTGDVTYVGTDLEEINVAWGEAKIYRVG